MGTQDLAIKYKALYQEIIIILDNIKEIGFDVSEYQKMLDEITNSVNQNVKVNYVKGFARASYEQDYARGIGELQSLKNYLDKYDIYYRVLNSSKWINMKCKDKNIDQETLEKYVSEMIYNLKLIVSSDTTDYDNEKHIVEEVYDTAYNLIKLELIMTGDSQLYRYAKNSDVNMSYFSILIKKDIRRQNKNIKLKEKLYEISKQGIGSSYFDLELIKILLVGDNNLDFKKAIVCNIKEVSDELENSTKRINGLVNEADDDVINIDGYKENLKDNLKIIKKKLTTYLVALSLIITGGVGVRNGAKKIATQDTYLKTTETYSSLTDDVTTDEKKIYTSSEPTNEVKIRVYQPYQDEKRRNYVEYDVSFQDFDTLKEYYEYGIDNYEVIGKVETAKKDNGDAISSYKDKYTEVISSTYEYTGIGLEKGLYGILLFFFYLIYLLLITLFASVYCMFLDDDIDDLKYALEEYNDDKKNYKEACVKLKKVIDKLMIEVNKNEELKNKFNQLYEANRYLLDNPDELMKRVNNLVNDVDSEKIKRLIKENKMGR